MDKLLLYLPILEAVAFGYLLGSIPFGLLLGKLAGAGDIRGIGSGNIGATNVLRTGRKGLAVLTLLLDAGKGAAAVLVTAYFTPLLGLAAGIAAVAGHCFPVWLKFKGGRGVATGFGVLLAALPLVGLLACATWAAVAAIFRFSSLAALAAYLAAPVYAAVFYDVPEGIFAAVISILIIVRHRANIARLRAGTEPRIGASP